MAKKLTTSTVFVLVFSLLFASIVYACSGLDSMRMASHNASMGGGAVEKGPCNDTKHDICKSVRYRMLSIQDSPSRSEISLQVSTIPLELSVDILAPLALPPAHLSSLTTFRRPLIYSYLVLRI